LPGPVTADVVAVIDGDTLRVRAAVWVDLSVETLVRIRGIDAPELRGRCIGEREDARLATENLRRAVGEGPVTLRAIAGDKYFGRVVADVRSAGGTDLAVAMLASGLARPYGGGTRASWCAEVGLRTEP
jgi:endonuclease YncB( thermonuclease family)